MFAAYRALLEELAAGPSRWSAPAQVVPAGVLAARVEANRTDGAIAEERLHDRFVAAAARRPTRGR